MRSRPSARLSLLIALPAAASVVAGATLDSYWLGVVSQALVMGLAALGLDVLSGWCGMPSLGQAAYFGIAAYVLAILTTRWDVDPWLAGLAGVACATVVAAAFGPLAVRTRGLAFLTVTLAFGQVSWGVAVKWRDVTGGSDGVPGVPRPTGFGGVVFSGPRGFYALVVVVVALMAAVVVRFMRGPFGLQLRGVRLSELRLRSLGYGATGLRVTAFVLAALVAAVAGTLFASFNQFVGNNSVDWRLSAQMLLAVVIGGPGSLWGPFVAGFGLFVLQIVATNLTERWTLILGLLYIFTVLFLPGGIASLVARIPRRAAAGGAEGDRAAGRAVEDEEGVVTDGGTR